MLIHSNSKEYQKELEWMNWKAGKLREGSDLVLTECIIEP